MLFLFSIHCWAGRRGRKGIFVKFGRNLLQELDDLKLSWLLFVPQSFSDEWGGWVSKHYASLTRVALWVYGPLMTIDDTPAYIDPIGDVTTWKVDALKLWLKVRGLNCTGLKAVLLERVKLYIYSDNGETPPILPPLYGSALDMFEMIQSLVILVTTLFQNKVEEHSPDIIDLRIRIF